MGLALWFSAGISFLFIFFCLSCRFSLDRMDNGRFENYVDIY